MDDYCSNFKQEYSRLNPEQKNAVDTIDGPVMVIAGAGTGKTQTIALRIANILSKTDTPASSILCLTFTDTASLAMRQRLLSIIGPTAYQIKIATFHSFCDEIIQTHPDYFIFAPDIRALDPLEKIDILNRLITKLPQSSPLKPWGDPLYYQKSISGHLQTLKREGISPAKLDSLIQDEKDFLEKHAHIYQQLKSVRSPKQADLLVPSLLQSLTDDKNISPAIRSLLIFYQQSFSSGTLTGPAKSSSINLKNSLLKLFDNFDKYIPKQLELLKIYRRYQKKLQTLGHYDFDDMILFVNKAFKDHPDLLLSYQEQFQYLLVDEYQDTNTAQNQIIDQLSSFHSSPNVFVVGDDDQSIFRFQGASIENIYNFYQRHSKQVKLIVLKNNYRSHQLILDSSSCLISHNQNRIGNFIKDIDKSLLSQSNYDPDPINLFVSASELEENFYISQKIKSLIGQGTDPNQIAVLFRQNSDPSLLMELLSNQKINYSLLSGVNILESLSITKLVNLFSYFVKADNRLLYKILSYNFSHIPALTLAKLSRFAYRQKIPLIDLIGSDGHLAKAGLSQKSRLKLVCFSQNIAEAQKWLHNYPLERFFNRVIRRFGFLSYLIFQKDYSLLNQLNTFYQELKIFQKDGSSDLKGFLNRLTLYQENKLPLFAPQLSSDAINSVQFMTVHKAKGLEFDHVFIIQTVDKKWGNNRPSEPLSLPPGILSTEISAFSADQNEDERRLFYVALTRAKKQIYLSYSQINSSSRPQLPSQFISEIKPDMIQIVPPQAQLSHLALSSLFVPKILASDPHFQKYLKAHLKNHYKFNISHLNSYLNCPLCFYYKTILRIPAVKNKYMSLGTAVHSAFNQLNTALK
ncbi:ATP-dependent helicase, partial [Patescibacteria group bacterium]|nr:ATP-dependent helicase [Patescibacteria group bacterium]